MATKRFCKIFGLLACAALFCVVFNSPANATTTDFFVSTNGDLLLDFTDLSTRGGLGMGVYRTYNSWDTYLAGRFGDGWISSGEAYLTVQADGSVVIHEFGGGANNAFQPTRLAVRNSKDIVDEIMQAAEETGRFGSDADRVAYRQWLAAGHQEDEWESYVSLGLIKPQDPPIGETFFSNRFYTEFLTRVPEGYQRERRYRGGVYFQAFDSSGKLTRWWDPNGDYIAISYDKNGHVAEGSDNWGDRFVYSTSSTNLMNRISDTPDHVVIYQYEDAPTAYGGSDLMSVSVDGKVTHYGYDSSNRLITVWYPDQTAVHITYDQNDRATSIKDGDGSLTSYSYVSCTSQKTLCSFEKDTRGQSGPAQKDIIQFSYDAAGNKTQEVETQDGTIVRTTAYDSRGRVHTVTTRKGTTEYGYDDLGRETSEKDPDGTALTWQYDPATRGVSVVTRTERGSSVTEDFQYDPKGNLVRAYDSAGHEFSIDHDPHGRISAVSGDGLNISFAYTDARATYPNTIALAGAGSVNLTYLGNGTVSKAQSSAGVAVVDKVRSALQSVDALISDAFFHMPALPASDT